MCIKYIILLCLTYYYIPTVISFDVYTMEIARRFNDLKNKNEDYVTFDSMSKTFDASEINELESLMEKYGKVEINGDNGQCERRVYIDKFTEAARLGLINKYPKTGVARLFFDIIEFGAPRDYIIRSDLVRYYLNEGERLRNYHIDFIMTTFGKKQPDGHRELDFHGFRRALNTLNIPVSRGELELMLELL